MNRWAVLLAVILLTAAVAFGCSSGGGNPTAPSAGPDLTGSVSHVGQAQTHLWGYYDVYIDIESQTVEAVMNRMCMFTANVVTFVNNPVTNLSFKIYGTPVTADYVDVDIDVTIKHPFPGMNQYDGYDVRGVFMGTGAAALKYDSKLKHAEYGANQTLYDYNDKVTLAYTDPYGDSLVGMPDGYTRWFNAKEFIFPGIMGYTQGKLATPNYQAMLTATLNPYKYFADGLGADEDLWTWLNANPAFNGVFTAGTSNTRNYYLRFPTAGGVKYGYAIVASWKGEAPENHPANASEAAAISAYVTPDVYYVSGTEKGGDLILDVNVWGWDYQPSVIKIESTVLSAVHEFDAAEMTPTGGDANYSTYHAEIPADAVSGTDGNEFWVVAEYGDFDYTCEFTPAGGAPDATLAAFFRYDLFVSNTPYNLPPVCDLQVVTTMPAEGWSPVAVEFDATGSSDPNGDPITFEWDFNDDGTFGDTYESGTDDNPTKEFDADYTGDVCVRVTDPSDEEDICCESITVISHATKNIGLRAGIAAEDIAIDHGDGDLFIFYTDNTLWRYQLSQWYATGSEFVNAANITGGFGQISRRFVDAAPNGYVFTCCHSNDYSATYNSTGWNVHRWWSPTGAYVSGLNLYPGANGTMLPLAVDEAQAWPTGSSFSNDMGGVYGLTVAPQESITMVRVMDEGAYAFTVNVNAHRHRYLFTPPPLIGSDRAYWQYIQGTETMPNDKVWLLEKGPDYYASRFTPSGTGWAPPANAPLAYDNVTFGTGTQTDSNNGFYDPKDITRNNGSTYIFVLDLLSTGQPSIKVFDVSGAPSSVGDFGDSTSIDTAPLRIEGSDFNGNVVVLHGPASGTSKISLFTAAEMPF